jgi:nucleotide-binding universal stress UspA family protein
MAKFILVPSTGEETDAPVFATAVAVARRFESHLAFLHVRPDVRQEISALAASEVGAVAGIADTMDRMEHDADAHERAAEAAWRDLCEREQITMRRAPPVAGVSAEWRCETGMQDALVAEHGRAADMLVVGRARAGGGIALDVLEAALMNTGRPVLIAPPAPPTSVGRIVTIAWKDTAEAAGAVAAAHDFIANSERIIILTVEEGENADDQSAERLQAALRWHNPEILLHRLTLEQRSPAETLLEAVARAGSDLLVMGGYGHTRLREAVFGGFTRHVLEHATLPVLISH